MSTTKINLHNLTILLLLIYPLVAPIINHGVTTIFAIIFFISLAGFFSCRALGNHLFKNFPKWMYPLLLVYPSAILIQDIYFKHWDGQAFDAASHMILGLFITAFLITIPKQTLNWILLTMALAGIVTLAYLGAYPNQMFDNRFGTELMGPTRLPHYITIFAIISIPLLKSNTWQKYLICIGVMATLIIVLFSQTRGAWLSTFVIISFFMYYVFEHSLKKFLTAIAMMFLMTVIIATSIPSVKERVSAGLNEVNHKIAAQSVMPRFEIWKLAINVIKEHPVMGIGRNNFAEVRDKLIQEKKAPAYLVDLPHPHNELLFAWVETGLLGFIGLTLLYLLPGHYFWKIWRKNDPETKLIAFCGLNVIIYYFLAGLSDIIIIASTLKTSIYVLNIAILIALLNGQDANQNKAKN